MSVRFVDEFRDGSLAKSLAGGIRVEAKPGRNYNLMEFCGGHTHAIFRYGVPDLLPENVHMIHGPGCPVCVLPMGRIDDGLSIGERSDVIFAAFGDMMRVPSSTGSLLDAKADVNAQDSRGWTALRHAVDREHVEAAQLLTERGAVEKGGTP